MLLFLIEAFVFRMPLFFIPLFKILICCLHPVIRKILSHKFYWFIFTKSKTKSRLFMLSNFKLKRSKLSLTSLSIKKYSFDRIN